MMSLLVGPNGCVAAIVDGLFLRIRFLGLSLRRTQGLQERLQNLGVSHVMSAVFGRVRMYTELDSHLTEMKRVRSELHDLQYDKEALLAREATLIRRKELIQIEIDKFLSGIGVEMEITNESL